MYLAFVQIEFISIMYFILTLALLEMFTPASHMFSSFSALVSNPESATAYSEQFYQNSPVVELII
jgi:hypothetical protein